MKLLKILILIFLLSTITINVYADRNRGEYSLFDIIDYWTRLELRKIKSKELTDYFYKRILYWQERNKKEQPKLEEDKQINRGGC